MSFGRPTRVTDGEAPGAALPSHAWMRLLSITLLFWLPVLPDAAAARIDTRRVMEAETMDKLPILRSVSFMPQNGLAVLGRGRSEGLPSSAHLALTDELSVSAVEVGLVVGWGLSGLVGAKSQREDQARDFRIRAASMLNVFEKHGEWTDLQAAWQRGIAEVLRESDLASHTLEVIDPTTGAYDPKQLLCEPSASCLTVATLWGLSEDGRRVEAQTRIRIWSRALHGSEWYTDLRSEFTNVLLYRSAAVPEIDRKKTDHDRHWLLELAEKEYAGLNLGPLIATANATHDMDARTARRAVVSYQRDQRRRVNRAKSRKWSDHDLAIVTARQWGTNGREHLRSVLEEAMAETLDMLRIELSKEGQAAKQRKKFRPQDAHATALVLRDGEREIVYLNDGTMVSRIKGDTRDKLRPWRTYYDEAAARAPAAY